MVISSLLAGGEAQKQGEVDSKPASPPREDKNKKKLV